MNDLTASQDLAGAWPSLSQANTPAPRWGLPWLRTIARVIHQRQSDFWRWSDCRGLCNDPRGIPPPAPLAPTLLPSGARSCWVQEEHTPRVNWISSPRASAPAVWTLTLSLTGWWQWPSRRKALPYTWFYPKPVSVSRVLLWSTHSFHCFRWKWHLWCHVRCLSRTYSLIIITSGF